MTVSVQENKSEHTRGHTNERFLISAVQNNVRVLGHRLPLSKVKNGQRDIKHENE